MPKLKLIKYTIWGLLACYIVGQSVYLCVEHGINMSAFRPAIICCVAYACSYSINKKWGARAWLLACLLALFFAGPYIFAPPGEGIPASEQQDFWSAEALSVSLALGLVFLIIRFTDWRELGITVGEFRKRRLSDNLEPYRLMGITVFTGYATYLAHLHAIHQISTYGNWLFVAFVACGAAVYMASISKLIERPPENSTQDAVAENVEL